MQHFTTVLLFGINIGEFRKHLYLLTLSYSVVAFILSMQLHNSRPQFTIKAEEEKAADESCLFATFNIKTGNIADCLGRCLENCRCQSFQICQNTKCQLCSSHKEENRSLLHDKNGCIYATYEMRNYAESNVEVGFFKRSAYFYVFACLKTNLGISQ